MHWKKFNCFKTWIRTFESIPLRADILNVPPHAAHLPILGFKKMERANKRQNKID